MRNSFSKIVLILIAIIILPTAFYSLYELSSHKKYEQIIENIYANQLMAILFSVNQYSDEILNEQANKIDRYISGNEADNYQSLNELLKNNPSLRMVFKYDKEGIDVLAGKFDSVELSRNYIDDILDTKQEDIDKLIQYYNNDYRKLQPQSLSSGYVMIYFIGETGQEYKVVYGMVIDAGEFINETLAPRIQEISQDKFNISIYRKGDNALIFNTDRNDNPPEAEVFKDMWLFPDYYAAIEMKGMEIADLIRNKSRQNIFYILLVDIMLIVGIVLVFKSIKKQIHLAQLKSDFVSNISHDIRTPLSLIYMYAESLKMGRVRSREKEKEYLEVLLKETRRLSGIVNKILNFSQIEKGKREYNFERINLNEIVKEVLSTYSYHLKNKDFNYDIDLDSEILTIMADKEAVTDAVVNLIDNSIKYSLEKKYIEIKTGKSSDYIYLEVRDKGKGISEKELKHIFDQFYRVTSTDITPETKGSGLGLSIVKHIMDAHKGIIKVFSKKGKGSRFILYFPVQI